MKRELKTDVRDFPNNSGVYQMKDSDGTIIYVGKAKNLKNRVRSYFSRDNHIKTKVLMSKVAKIEYIVTDNEYEALLLENNLIKEHSPRYNINLKDGKTYPVIRITADTYPRIFRTRRIVQDGSRYYGPYPNVTHLETYLQLIDSLFPLRKCRTAELKPREKPCLYYHIGRCAGVCAGKTSHAEYMTRVEEVIKLLDGKTQDLRKSLQSKMIEAAERKEYEKAAELRDTISSIESIESAQHVVDFDPDLRDYIGFTVRNDRAAFVLFQMRHGKLLDSRVYYSPVGGTDEETLEQFLLRYYATTNAIPDRIFLSAVIADRSSLETFFRSELGKEPRILSSETSRDASILRLATQNALHEIEKRLREEGDLPALLELQEVLGLPRPPLKIEAFDIAHVGGRNTVASMVSFSNGTPDRGQYRRYRIRSLEEGAIDDFTAISEAVARRYTRVKNENLPRPDLILVDGGKGQVSSARKVLQALEMDSIPLVGLAKRNEEIFFPHTPDPLLLPEGSPPLRILQYLRDEAHRFATGYRARLQGKDLTRSTLENIPGIGERRAKALLTRFSSLEMIQETPEDIVAGSTSIPIEIVRRVQASLREGNHRASRSTRL